MLIVRVTRLVLRQQVTLQGAVECLRAPLRRPAVAAVAVILTVVFPVVIVSVAAAAVAQSDAVRYSVLSCPQATTAQVTVTAAAAGVQNDSSSAHRAHPMMHSHSTMRGCAAVHAVPMLVR
eukprot:19187-Heterococcus_DN1.PRE.2